WICPVSNNTSTNNVILRRTTLLALPGTESDGAFDVSASNLQPNQRASATALRVLP
ncbi:hypothetical protein CHARACLAT_023880, partial [Characodon lateralis]|nr:hypothetical protein [Characodon lateralis]